MKFSFLKISFIHLFVFSGWLLLSAKVFHLQNFPDERIDGKIKSQFASHIKVRARRGDILDRNGRVLATSVITKSAFIDPELAQIKPSKLSLISKITAVPLNELKNIMKKKTRFVWLKRKLSEAEFLKLSELNLRGLGFLDEYKRLYPGHESLKFLIGKVNIDGEGLSGLELYYDESLSGGFLKKKALRDGKGRALLLSDYEAYEELKGKNINLTIDLDIQAFSSDELEQGVLKVEGARGWAAVLDLESGEIVANAQFHNQKTASFKNILTSEIHEQGSVLKTFSFLKAIEAMKIKPSTTFDCSPKGFKIGSRRIRNAHEEDCEKISLVKAFAKSLNTVSAELALSLGEKKLINFYKELGFDKETGVDFPGEASPIFHNKLSGPHQLASLSFGHGVALTPLQVLKAYALLFSKDKSLKPKYLLDRTQDYKKNKTSLMNEKQKFLAKNLLSSVVSEEGTGFKADVVNYMVGGKTGTAQKPDFINGGYSKEVLSTFVGVFPLTRPKYITLVTVDEPQTMRSGGSVSAPIFSKIAAYILRKDQTPPDNILAKNIEDLSIKSHFSLIDAPPPYEKGTVPNLEGLTLREVLDKANDIGFKVEFSGNGRVASMSPKPGTKIPLDRKVNIQLKL